MRNLNLDQLRTFVAVAELQSFSKAAVALNLTQSAVSQQIKELEGRLAVRLLDRLGKKAHATAAGEDLLVRAAQLLSQAAQLEEAMQLHREGGWARVRLAASAGLAAYVLPPILRVLQAEHPDLEVSVVVGGTREILRRVASNEADIGFVFTTDDAAEPALSIEAAYQTALLLYWPMAFGDLPDAVEPRHLIDKPFIHLTPENLNHTLVTSWFRQARCQPTVVMEFDTGLSVVPLVEAGIGASILPSEFRIPLKRAKNVLVRPTSPAINVQASVAVHREKPQHHSLRIVYRALLSARAP